MRSVRAPYTAAATAVAIAFPVAAIAIFAPQAVTNVFTARGYMPHAHCYLWQPSLIALHGISDVLIGVAYLVISLALAFLVYRARSHIPFEWMVLAFGLFIIACGMTHFMEVVTLWTPLYWLAADVKAVTAIASVATAVALPPLVPRILALVEAEDVAQRRGEQLAEKAYLLAEEQKARAKAEEADRAKDQFLAMVSHELRTPLSPILAWSRMLVAGTVPEATRRQALAAIERNATTQAQLIEDLLDVSRIVSGKLRLDVRPTVLGPVIESAVDALRPSAEAKRIRLGTVIDSGAGTVLGDPERLQQVVWNLVANAIKFTPKDGRVQVVLARVDSHLEITVNDTGAGIEAELLPHVFERFWQAESGVARRYGGLGLGLAIVRHLVESHGGEVSAQSDGEDKGSVFTVKLPLMATAAPVDGRGHHLAGVDGGTSIPSAIRLDGVRALVVDDEPDSNEMVMAVLGSAGAEVRVAASARQALAILDRWRADVIVSDIGMPEEDGYALIAQVRARVAERGGATPAIALTAYARVEDRIKMLTAGFQMYLSKPVDPAELVATVAGVARRPGYPGTAARIE
jgi:signal transduction histidine kinase/ActR/RegA family two-component response regulator